MRLFLGEIINIPGGVVPFEYELDISEYTFDSVEEFTSPVGVKGQVANRAGVLTVTGKIITDMTCVCARCLDLFPKHLDLDLNAFLAEELQDEDSEDIYLLDGDYADIDEIAFTTLVLNMEQRFLCKEDCKGLCPKCGKNLNDGPCDCREDQDPRLAVLGQLLENND
jgi:uncharacterized protein